MIDLQLEDLLVPSEWINKNEVGKCYVAIFPNTHAKDI
jgi:hypothetical protein